MGSSQFSTRAKGVNEVKGGQRDLRGSGVDNGIEGERVIKINFGFMYRFTNS